MGYTNGFHGEITQFPAVTSAQVPSDRALLPVLSSLVHLRGWRQALRLLPQRGAVGAAALAMTWSAVAATAQPVGEIRKDGGDSGWVEALADSPQNTTEIVPKMVTGD